MNSCLDKNQLRKVIDSIYDGESETFFWIMQIQAFYVKKANVFREQQVYLWCIKNKVTGKKFIEFFNCHGFLNGLNFIVNKMDGRKYSQEKIKINEAY